jgi:hypothetical protein
MFRQEHCSNSARIRAPTLASKQGRRMESGGQYSIYLFIYLTAMGPWRREGTATGMVHGKALSRRLCFGCFHDRSLKSAAVAAAIAP